MDKLLSIIVPSYNMEKYLPKCLGSLIVDDAELLQKLDVIVVNDGSKDRTSEIAHDFERRYPGVFRVIDKPNGNYGSCINAALRVAQGLFVKVLDADDSFDVGRFGSYLAFLSQQREDVDLVLSDFDKITEDGTVLSHHSFEKSFPVDTPFPVESFVPLQHLGQMHAYAYRRSMLRDLGYRQCEGVSYSDTEWSVVPLVGVRKVAYCHECVYLYLKGREGQTMDPKVRQRDAWMQSKVALHAACQIDDLFRKNPNKVREAIQKLSIKTIADVYRSSLMHLGIYPELDTGSFDADLKKASSTLYVTVGEVGYTRKLPYHFIRAWRNHSWHWPIMRWLCRLYSRSIQIVYRMAT